MRPRIFIAAPISKGDLLGNIQQADAAFFKLVEAGFAPFNPVLSVFAGTGNSVMRPDGTIWVIARTIHTIPWEQWLAISCEWVAVCDAVLRLPGESKGADLETEIASTKGIPVFTDLATLIAFFKGSSHAT